MRVHITEAAVELAHRSGGLVALDFITPVG